jgi:Trk K+ transport system NAD-binding subunit
VVLGLGQVAGANLFRPHRLHWLTGSALKFISTQLSYFLGQRQIRQNLGALLKFLALLGVVIVVFAVLFHFIMAYEGQDHSWVTGFYWTLTVMSTLGFGDITFLSDLGRAFSIFVLLSGIILLLIVLPFTFIRFFYAPWLEAQLNTRAPREAPPDTRDHVVICEHDPIAASLVDRLALLEIPYLLIEKDAAAAAELRAEGVSVIAGDPEAVETWEAVRIKAARGVFANSSDPRNTNITLTVRQQCPDVSIIAKVDSVDSIDILELAGATEVLPLKQRLGESLANRVNAGHAEAHVIGELRGFVIAEFPVHNTPLVGRTLRDTKLRQVMGINVVGVWERGRFEPPRPDMVLTKFAVPVVIGTPEQILELNTLLVIYDTNYNPTVIIGGGQVGVAAAKALRRREIPVHIVEKDETVAARISGVADRVICGDAADRAVMTDAGLEEAPTVILSTNDDSINVYLAAYCRRLNPELRIISRITHDRSLEAIHRAGADFVLSYTTLGAESVISAVQGRGLMMLGSGVELFQLDIPKTLVGKTISETQIGARTGLTVIAVQNGAGLEANPSPKKPLPPEGELLVLGTPDQRQEFITLFR